MAVENCGFFQCGRQAGHGLRVSHVRRHFENLLRQMIDAIKNGCNRR